MTAAAISSRTCSSSLSSRSVKGSFGTRVALASESNIFFSSAPSRKLGWGVTQISLGTQLVQSRTARNSALPVLGVVRTLHSRACDLSGQHLTLRWFQHPRRRRRHAPQETQSWWRWYLPATMLRIRYGSRVLPGPSWGQLAQRMVDSTATLAYRSWRPRRGTHRHLRSRSGKRGRPL